MLTVVVIPTYNEADNVRPLAQAVLANWRAGTPARDKAEPQELSILFVDDNSPGGTGQIIDDLVATNPAIHVLHRTKKEGLGRAYVAGFAEALKLGADKIIEMDCDFSHPIDKLPELIASDADVTIGSRYIKGGKCVGWPFKRWLISRAGGIFIRFMLGMPINDPTGGFKCFKRRVLEDGVLDEIESMGYSFQLEMNYRMWKRGYSIKEIPITFSERRAGVSKISGSIAAESLRMVFKLRKAKNVHSRKAGTLARA